MIILKKTTKYNRIPTDIITKEYIMNIGSTLDLKNIILIKKLGFKDGGPIRITHVKHANMDAYKKIIIDNLYPTTH